MAVVKSFKQPCPSCEAMVTIKEGMVGKKVECHKCKDKFVAERPDEDEDEPVQVKPKKDAKAVAKSTKLSAKSPPPPTKKTKLTKPVVEEVDDVEDFDEIEDIDEDEDAPPAKSSKGKNASKPVSKKSSKSVDDDDSPPIKKGAAAGNKKLTMGLALAGVGVVILVVAAVLLMRGGGGGRTTTPIVKGNDGGDEKKVEIKPGGDGPRKKIIDTDPTPKVADGTPVPLDANEIAKLTNLLPPDTEHVFHIYYANLLTGNSPLKDAVFQTPGTLEDKYLQRKLGFSLQSIDDIIVAEKFTAPGWKYTVIHFKDALKEDELQESLALVPVKTPIEGQNYFTMPANNHPWFDSLARFHLGVPAAMRSFLPAPKASLVRLHNSQTLIVGDDTPVKALLKAKGQFPLQSAPKVASNAGAGGMQFVTVAASDNDQLPPGGGQVGGGKLPSLENTVWQGTEGPANDRLRVVVRSGNKVVIESTKGGGDGTFTLTPSPAGGLPSITITSPTNELTYQGMGDLASKSITGMGKKGGESWNFTLKLVQSETPDPKIEPKVDPDPMPMTPAAAEKYATIKETLRKSLDMLEARASEGKDKLLFSSVTDMDANRVETNSPDFVNQIVRRPRQFWDVTQILIEQKPRIRTLGTVLIMRDLLRYQFINEVTCAQELDAKEFERDLTERGASQVARFIQGVARHEVRTPRAETKPIEPKVGEAQPPDVNPDEKKPATGGLSQIIVSQKANVLEFQLELVLDNTAMSQIQGIAAVAASTFRVEMDWLATGKGRHTLAQTARTLGERGLSIRQIEAGKFPPGAFPRPDSLSRIDREPKNRISFMAGLLPYLGHQNLFNRIRFDQSWRDPGNWMAGNTIVPQFLDPMVPDSAQYVTFGDLPVDFAATHYVGIAGVGMDAASFKRNDPATINQRGVFSYDESATLDEVRSGRGLANTILLIQTPHDGLTGVSPWIAGGGATLRGVPEKNSILPFVLTTDKNGKVIHNKNKRGTYALMTDGSVRFIDQNVSDNIFKAMATVNGPAPIEFNLNQDPNTPLIPLPDKNPPKKEPPTDNKAPAKSDAPKAEPEKKTSRADDATPNDAIAGNSVNRELSAFNRDEIEALIRRRDSTILRSF